MSDFDVGNIQFLDLTGVEEKEQQWILTSLKTHDSTVRGPWLQSNYQKTKMYQGCNMIPETSQMNINNCYPSPPNLILPPAVFPQPYQSPVPVFQQGFIPPVQYPPPIVSISPINAMVPVNGPIVPVNASVIPVNTQMLPVNPPLIPVNTPVLSLSAPILPNHYPPQQVSYQNYPANSQFHPPPQTEITTTNTDVAPIETYNEEVNNVEEIKENKPEETEVKTETKSWASLFNKKTTNESGKTDDSNKPLAKVSPFIQNSVKTTGTENAAPDKRRRQSFEDPNYYRMGEILANYKIDHKITSLQPRGLINRSNYCYINSILQAVIACPPFYNLMMTLSENTTPKDNRKHTQIIDNMIKFVKEFHLLPPGQRVNRRSDNKKKELTVSVNCDRPFEPYWIYKMLNGIRSDSFVVEGRQEDAEEFLGCLLNGLNDEMLELIKLVNEDAKPAEKDDNGPDGDKEWQLIGPKNKGCVTRRTEIIRTPISDLFGGHFRSRLHRAGDQITDNIQPFFTLQLNIEKVNTVKEALEALVCKNQLEGVTSSKTNEEVEAWQQLAIEELPVVLILHLKCFDFKLDGCTKIIKQLEFPIDLKIDTKLLSSKNNYQTKEKQYKLFAVVYHDGKEASKGHYVTDAYHIGYSSWLRYDDAAVKSVQEEHVLKPHGNRVPYLLFYRRSDTVRSK